MLDHEFVSSLPRTVVPDVHVCLLGLGQRLSNCLEGVLTVPFFQRLLTLYVFALQLNVLVPGLRETRKSSIDDVLTPISVSIAMSIIMIQSLVFNLRLKCVIFIPVFPMSVTVIHDVVVDSRFCKNRGYKNFKFAYL